MRFELTTSVDPDTVFAEIADFGRIGRWDPFVKSSSLEEGQPMSEGAVYRLESPGGLTLRYRIVEVTPHRVVYRGGTERVRSTDTIEVLPDGSGSRLSVTSELSFLGRMRLLAPGVRAMVWVGGRYLSFPALKRHLAGPA